MFFLDNQIKINLEIQIIIDTKINLQIDFKIKKKHYWYQNQLANQFQSWF